MQDRPAELKDSKKLLDQDLIKIINFTEKS